MTLSTSSDKTANDEWLDYCEKLHFDAFFWKEKANCKGVARSDNNRAFSPMTNVQSGFAEDYCTDCPVWRECLYYALVVQNEYGVWGGLTEAAISNIIKDLRAEFRSLRYNWSDELNQAILQKIKDIDAKR